MSDKVDTSPLKSSESSAVNEPVPKANTFNNSHLTGTSSCLIDMTINTTSNTIVEQDDDIMSLLDRSIVRRPSVDITDMGTLRQATDAAEKRRRKGYDADGANVGSFNETNPPPGKEFDSFQKGCIRINWKGISRRILDRVFSQILPAGDTKSLKDLLDTGHISVNEIQVEVGLNLFLDPNTAIKHVLTISFSFFYSILFYIVFFYIVFFYIVIFYIVFFYIVIE